MPPHTAPTFLLASPEPALLAAIEPLLSAAGERVEVVLSAQAALASMTAPQPPGLALLDESLPGMPIGQLLAAVRTQTAGARLPIVLIADTVTEAWIDRLAEGAIDDLILRSAESSYWQLRIDLVLRNQRMAHELETLRDSSLRNAQLDRLTGVYNREALLAMLFRETDRVQRTNSSLSLVLFDIDDFGHWNSRLGVDACDELLCQVASRTGCPVAQLRSAGPARHGRVPGGAALLQPRQRHGPHRAPARRGLFFALPRGRRSHTPLRLLRHRGQPRPLPGCGSARGGKSSRMGQGRRPRIHPVLRQPSSPHPSPVTFLSATSGDELLAW